MADASALSSAARFVCPLEAKKPRGRARLGVRPLHEDQQCVPYQSSMLLSVCYPTLIADISRREAPVEANSEEVRAVGRGALGRSGAGLAPGGLAGLRAVVARVGLLHLRKRASATTSGGRVAGVGRRDHAVILRGVDALIRPPPMRAR